MAHQMEKIGGTSEEDDMEMDMGVKEEEEEDYNDERSQGLLAGLGGRFFNQETASSEQIQIQGVGGRRSRPKEEKERTKLRERHRRAITARILAGLRRHGNYNLRLRADINDVIAALAREAGWVVLPDGTTFPSRSSPSSSQVGRPAEASPLLVAVSHRTMPPMKGVSPTGGEIRSGDYRQCRLKGVYMPPSAYDGRFHQGVAMGGERCNENSPLVTSCMETTNEKLVIDLPQRTPEPDFAGTPYVPVNVMLPLGVIDMKCELVDPEGLIKQLRILKSINIDGVMVDCWWGIVEASAPLEYNWHGYERLFQIVRELKLKLQVVMSFHECGGNICDDVCIPLPHWVAEIGRSNPDIFFTDREGRRNPECLSWGIDKERVLRGRTALEVHSLIR
ncbi:Beta-amylase 7 [Platanthera guangdongensis]|uniref:Beta-amylase n=1 Tax=Platanthera guangdongensis TaxID=2320717 RepID=A0ABR2MVL5_9ASPA